MRGATTAIRGARANYDHLGRNLRKVGHFLRGGQNSIMTISGKTRGISASRLEKPRENEVHAGPEFWNFDAAAAGPASWGGLSEFPCVDLPTKSRSLWSAVIHHRFVSAAEPLWIASRGDKSSISHHEGSPFQSSVGCYCERKAEMNSRTPKGDCF